MLSELIIAGGDHVHRRVLLFLAVSVATTLKAVLGSVLAMALPVRLSAMSHVVCPWAGRPRDIDVASMTVLSGFPGVSVRPLHRFIIQPSRRQRPWITPGTALTPALWLLALTLLTFCAEHSTRFGVAYRLLGAVVAAIVWVFVTTYAVSMGAEPGPQLGHLSAAPSAPTMLVLYAI